MCREGDLTFSHVMKTRRCRQVENLITSLSKLRIFKRTPEVMQSLERTCITAAPSGASRCWWTYVPEAVSTSADTSLRVPLVIDMHGGGGCAEHQFSWIVFHWERGGGCGVGRRVGEFRTLGGPFSGDPMLSVVLTPITVTKVLFQRACRDPQLSKYILSRRSQNFR